VEQRDEPAGISCSGCDWIGAANSNLGRCLHDKFQIEPAPHRSTAPGCHSMHSYRSSHLTPKSEFRLTAAIVVDILAVRRSKDSGRANDINFLNPEPNIYGDKIRSYFAALAQSPSTQRTPDTNGRYDPDWKYSNRRHRLRYVRIRDTSHLTTADQTTKRNDISAAPE